MKGLEKKLSQKEKEICERPEGGKDPEFAPNIKEAENRVNKHIMADEINKTL